MAARVTARYRAGLAFSPQPRILQPARRHAPEGRLSIDAHAIVRSDDVLDGRWRFEGTAIAVADIRRDYAIGDGPMMEPYRRQGISERDIRAALAFEFPEIRGSRVDVDQSTVTVHCVCGEDSQQAIAWPAMTVRCVCNRLWKIAIAVDRLANEPAAGAPNGDPAAQGADGDRDYQPPRLTGNGDQ